MQETDNPLLIVENIEAGYGGKSVIQGVSLTVNPGEIVAVIGHNGAGKSTLLRTIFGLLPVLRGTIIYCGQNISLWNTVARIRAGITYVPQGNRVFSELSVFDNLEIAGGMIDTRILSKRLDKLFSWFPSLASKKKQISGTLSGGEQQMLALSMGLLHEPKLLILDEPSIGLSPSLVDKTFEHIIEINQQTGAAILVVEQKVKAIVKIAHRVYVLRTGKVSYSGLAKELRDEKRLREVYL